MGKIIWLASYPKSGNTWVRAFLANYISNTEKPFPINELSNSLILKNIYLLGIYKTHAYKKIRLIVSSQNENIEMICTCIK